MHGSGQATVLIKGGGGYLITYDRPHPLTLQALNLLTPNPLSSEFFNENFEGQRLFFNLKSA